MHTTVSETARTDLRTTQQNNDNCYEEKLPE